MRHLVLAAALALAPLPVLAQSAPPTAMAQAQTRATALLERDAYSSDGTRVGEVEDLLLDAEGRVAGVVVEVDGGIGRRDRHVMLPFAQLRTAERRVVLPMTAEQIRAMPGFDYRD